MPVILKILNQAPYSNARIGNASMSIIIIEGESLVNLPFAIFIILQYSSPKTIPSVRE